MKCKRILTLLLSLLTILLSLCIFTGAEGTNEEDGVTILFTHDLHSHLLPSANEEGEGEYGGYARLMTLIKEQRAKDPHAILVDGGDFSMGSLFQTAYPTSAIELRMMGAIGYDATTFGNHEYDYLQSGLMSMLNAAVASGDPVPPIVCANYLPPVEGQEGYDAAMWDALRNYGVKDYVILERGGVHYVLFGIFGIEADGYAPLSGMILEDPIATARETVETAVKDCRDRYGVDPIVICLSHSGTKDGKGEDYELAKAVDGIDVIVSGHTHTTLREPITVNGTLIVSAAEYGRNLGVLKLTREGKFKSYELIPVDETVAEDPAIAALIEGYKTAVEENYLNKYGFSFDQALVHNPYAFDTVDQVYDTQHESTLGNLFSDAYKQAVEKTTGERVDVALTASGVIRGSLPVGAVTVSDIFNAASLGVGTEGELIAIYLTGHDLKNVLELDASVQPIMNTAQLFLSGVEYSFNRWRMIFNKVDYAMLRGDDGTLTEIRDDELYYVVSGMYIGQMLSSAEESSMGILTVTPRDAEGNPIPSDDLVNYVVKDENGAPLKEWYAIATYLNGMGGELDSHYAQPDGRKVVYTSLNPVKLLRNANVFSYVALGVILVLLTVMALIVRCILKRVRKKKKATA